MKRSRLRQRRPGLGPTALPGDPIERLLRPLRGLARGSEELYEKTIAQFSREGMRFEIPRFTLLGPPGGGDPLRIGVFAAIHGDEPEGAMALVDFVRQLAADPEPARGYHIQAYPVCNPSGFVDGTRHSRAGLDLNREFWRGSREPEVSALEGELRSRRFHGIVSLHSDDTADGVYAFARGATITEGLVRPVLAAASRHLPLADGPIIDGFEADRGVLRDCYQGILTNPDELHPAPFEIIFETPQRAPRDLQVAATTAALFSVLDEYRGFMATGDNI
ncbi:MAG TPA: succinylglutamate desuccinylase/aspartoacylase family protein [Verrucomicrobiae bacterium]|nr:succinylglutamate desuccinylase/aspartoacylase family protein [Verrucomicrobiae bacterium]